jgi:hypothetical protein
MAESPVENTLIRKITIGTPVRKVTGAQAQTLGDLTDVSLTGIKQHDLIQFNAATGKFENTTEPDGLFLTGGTF